MVLGLIFRTLLPLLLGAILLAYIVVRAVQLPITHDEANTCVTYSVMSVCDIITYAKPVPNNHIVNTLGVKFFSSLFGMHPLPVRIPNILGFILYFISVYLLVLKISRDPFITFFGICVLTCNPYLIDFFSLARGYALSISFMLVSMLFTFLFMQKSTHRNLAGAVLAGALAVYTNFTLLNYFAPLTGLLSLTVIQNAFTIRSKPAVRGKGFAFVQFIIIISITLLLAMACYIPIKKMIATDQLVFWGTNGFLKDTVHTLLYAGLYNAGYQYLNVNVFTYLIIGFAGIIAIVSVWEFVRCKFVLAAAIPSFFAFLLFGAIAVNIIQFVLFNVPYLTSRTALFFYPLLAVNFVFFAEWMRSKWIPSRIYFSLVLSVLSVIHFARAANFEKSFEWWFDADTYTVLNALEQEHLQNNKQITLKGNWWFFPSLNFHILTENKEWITLAGFHEEFDTLTFTSYDYYYLNAEHIHKLKNSYDTLLSLGGNTRFLMKIKEQAGESLHTAGKTVYEFRQ